MMAHTTTSQQAHTTREDSVGDLIEGRFPQHTNAIPAQKAEAAGRIDVRDFRQNPTVDEAYGIPTPHAIEDTRPAVPHVVTADDQADKAAPTGPAGAGVASETARLLAKFAAAGLSWSRERWTEESARRRELRRELRPAVRDARAAYRRAKSTDPQRVLAETHAALRRLRKVKRAVPDRLPVLAGKVGIGAAALGYVAATHVQTAVWAWSAVGLAAAAVAGIASVAAWVRLHPKPVPAITPTEEEQRLLDRLQPEYWTEHAKDRGLEGTLTGRPDLTAAGIVVHIRLDGKWTVGDLRKAEENIRALLGARTGLRMQVEHGTHGGWATLTIRTRSAADSSNMRWTPGAVGLGLDTVTGEPVVLSPYGFRLVAGATGMGKSVSQRPWIAEVLANPLAAPIYIDPKHQEYRLWQGKCRVEHEKAAIYKLAKELQAELSRRQKNSTGTTWTPTRQDPELVVFVDEGAVIVRMAKQKGWKDILDIFEEIATMGRAARIWLIWATQYPTKEQGIPAQVVEMMLDRVALSVESAQADRVIFGEKAGDTGWQPSELPALPGLSLVKTAGRKPNPVRGWFLDDETAASLPKGIVWHGQAPAVEPTGDGRHLAAVRDLDDYADPTDETASVDERVLGAVARAEIPMRQADIVKTTGANQGTVSKAIKRLIESGDLVREGNLLVLSSEADEEQPAATA